MIKVVKDQQKQIDSDFLTKLQNLKKFEKFGMVLENWKELTELPDIKKCKKLDIILFNQETDTYYVYPSA